MLRRPGLHPYFCTYLQPGLSCRILIQSRSERGQYNYLVGEMASASDILFSRKAKDHHKEWILITSERMM